MSSTMLPVLLLAALACLATASPVSPTNTTVAAAAKSTNGGVKIASWSPTCPNNRPATYIKINRRDVPYHFDVHNAFWAQDDNACALAAMNSGFHGAVYRSDSKLCHLKNFPQNQNRKIVDDESIYTVTVYGYDIPGYDMNAEDGWYDLWVQENKDNGRIWLKGFDICDVCTMLLWQC
ncbi:hypothetical protein BC828DRAFT_408437 [Blastocladiella britannica]|nr:hypothetical protein BC828DRAFT_408437 [Blastocladiella britannica]